MKQKVLESVSRVRESKDVTKHKGCSIDMQIIDAEGGDRGPRLPERISRQRLWAAGVQLETAATFLQQEHDNGLQALFIPINITDDLVRGGGLQALLTRCFPQGAYGPFEKVQY